MDKILISNSFKNLLQSLGAKDASNLSNISSKAVPVVDTASGSAGTLLGYSTMSTLASVLGAMAQQTEIIDQGSSVDISLPYGSTWVFKDTIGQSCAIINIAYSGCILVASTPQWSAESEQQSTNHVIKVNKNVITDGIIRITRVGNTSCRYRYRQLIG